MLTNVSGDSVSLHSYEDLGRFVIFKNTILKYLHTKKSKYSENKALHLVILSYSIKLM